MNQKQAGSIRHHFSSMNDPRRDNSRHNLLDIITISICAIISGASGFSQIQEFGKAKYEWFKEFLELPHGIPSHDTIGRIFARLDPNELREAFIDWVSAISSLVAGEVIPIDGKTLRRSFDNDAGKSAIHMVSAWASSSGIVLGQIKTDEKSNEITAIPELIKSLEIEGCIISTDAMGCQKKVAEAIVDKNGDYVFGLKGNHGTMANDVEVFFQDYLKNNLSGFNIDTSETIEKDHGRLEIRRYWTTSDIDWLQGKDAWKKFRTICMVEREVHANGKISKETGYYIGSIPSDAKLFGRAVRSHWGVENSLHWVLDVSFREDESRIRKDNAPENLAILRHLALNMIKKETSTKKSIRMKQLRAGWDNEYLKKILAINS
jgi:predicted transposase YbfD/YdcC